MSAASDLRAGRHAPTPAAEFHWAPVRPATGADDERLLRNAWHRAPYFVTIRATTDSAVTLQATIGTRGSRTAFLERVAVTTGRLRDRLAPAAVTVEFVLPAEMAEHRSGAVDRLLERLRDRLMTEWWGIGELPRSTDVLTLRGPVECVAWWNDRGQVDYVADPFPWPAAGQILCEEMPLVGGHGRIVALPWDGSRAHRSKDILVSSAHHSYPCLLEDADSTWLLPESTARGATVLYRLHPDGSMAPVCVIAPDLRMADSTLFRHADRYWIAYTDLDLGDHDNLCLLYADGPQGPWHRHHQNPVKIDVRGARPAGMPFDRGGRLFRPGQNCAATYGAGITIYEILALTPEVFDEVPVASLAPDPNGRYPHGLHTLVSYGDRVWVDGKRFIFSPRVLFDRLRRRLKRSVDRSS